MRAHTACTAVAAFWWCSLTVIGFIVVPLLFTYLPSPSLAGFMAAKLFAAQTWLSTAAAAALLVLVRGRGDAQPLPVAAAVLPWVIAGLLAALILQYGVSPRIVARQDLRWWHTVGSVLYLAQWLCAGRVFWHLLRAPSSLAPSHPVSPAAPQ